jgi:hypothetical protein
VHFVARGGTEERYATQVGVLWSGLARTLGELDRLAADPGRLDEDDVRESLQRLQYRLHVASEEAYGLAPPTGVEPVHAELAAALAGARDSTADLVEGLEEDGLDAAMPCVPEWRGALFRVRLARLRLAAPLPAEPEPVVAPDEGRGHALVSLLLLLAGAAAFAGGAVGAFWPLWAIGIAFVCSSFIAYKP